MPGNDAVDVSAVRLTELRMQLESHLRPVLREAEFGAFDLARAFALVTAMARRME